MNYSIIRVPCIGITQREVKAPLFVAVETMLILILAIDFEQFLFGLYCRFQVD